MYTSSMSGRSSRSTLMLTKSSFMSAAISALSKTRASMTWHQWHEEYPSRGGQACCARERGRTPRSPRDTQSTGCGRVEKVGLVLTREPIGAPHDQDAGVAPSFAIRTLTAAR